VIVRHLCDKICNSFHSIQSLEKFSGLTTQVAYDLEAFMRQIHDTEFPNSVEATEQLLVEEGNEYAKLKVSLIVAFEA